MAVTPSGAPNETDEAAHAATAHDHREEIVKEAATMALYVAVCLLAALAVASEADLDHRPKILAVVWGTTIGLALAHWFAFRLSARLVSGGEIRRTDAEISIAQLAGSVVVAILATIPVVLFDGADAQLEATTWVVVGVIAAIGFLVARASGASGLRSLVYTAAVLTVAAAVVVTKNALGGH